jgi:hypothetical protein
MGISRWYLWPPDRLGNSYVFYYDDKGAPSVTIGPHWPGVFVSQTMIVCGSLLNINVLKDHDGIKGEKYSDFFSMVMYIYICFMATTTTVLLWATALSDPGIVTRNINDEKDEESNMFCRDKVYCEACQLMQGENVDHCGDCGVCCEGLDHHCPWMSKCIGAKNMRVFIYFNVSWMIFLIEFLLLAFMC